jgi:hypothetical protein
MKAGFSRQRALPKAGPRRGPGSAVVLRTNGAPPVRSQPSMGSNVSRIPRGISFWDANHLSHMPLPRSTGPYSVTRVTTRMSTTKRVTIFGTFRLKSASGTPLGEWLNMYAVSDVLATNPVNGVSNAERHTHGMSGYGYETTVTPSAFSLQISNAEPLQTTGGMCYIGVCSSQLGISDSPETFDVWGERFVNTQKPCPLSAATLAINPKKVNSYPLNLESLCDFTELSTAGNTTVTWNAALFEPSGFAPIVVYNPGGLMLEVNVMMEWRTRFTLAHPAASTHSMHTPTPESTWHSALTQAAALGNGVLNAAEAVSRGMGAYRGLAAA